METETPRPLRVLVACEYSGVVRDAFRARGHHALSCDLLPTDAPGPHHTGDVFDVLADPARFFGGPIDLMVAHPPCTYMANSSSRHLYLQDEDGHTLRDRDGAKVPNPERWHGLYDGARFFRALWEADVPRIAVENPVMLGHAKRVIGRGELLQPTQTVQPYQHGHMESKATCLWLRNLPALVPTDDVRAATMALPYAQRAKVHHASPGPDRWKLRSTTYAGIAAAMADQWGALPPLTETPEPAQLALAV
jgi:hypothetical protein